MLTVSGITSIRAAAIGIALLAAAPSNTLADAIFLGNSVYGLAGRCDAAKVAKQEYDQGRSSAEQFVTAAGMNADEFGCGFGAAAERDAERVWAVDALCGDGLDDWYETFVFERSSDGSGFNIKMDNPKSTWSMAVVRCD